MAPETKLKRWRLIADEERSARWNMAADQAILEAVCDSMVLPTLRLYRWDTPAVTVGRFQDVRQGVNLEECARLDVPVIRRPTGGRGVLHGTDQTLSITVPAAFLGEDGASVVRSYHRLSEGFTKALELLGISTSTITGRRTAGHGGDCFASMSQADVLGPGGKLIGSAQRRLGGVLLMQCSLRHEPPAIAPEQVFRGPVGTFDYPLADIPETTLCNALVDGFRQALDVQMEEGSLSLWEEERSCVLMAELASCALVDTPQRV